MPNERTVAEVMATRLHTLQPEDDIFAAMEMFLKHRISGAPVVDHKRKVVGVLSEKDCMRLLLNSYFDPTSMGTVGEYMSTQVHTISSTNTVEEVARIFLEKPYRRLPVVDDGELVGQVSRRDVLAAIHEVVTKSNREVEDPSRQGSMITDGNKPDPVGPAVNRKWQ